MILIDLYSITNNKLVILIQLFKIKQMNREGSQIPMYAMQIINNYKIQMK
jgi:hypothetical protein